MPIIELLNNLAEFKYYTGAGNFIQNKIPYSGDRRGGGWSGQPFEQFPVDGISVPSSVRRYYELNRTSLDFPIRGGGLDYNPTTFTLTKAGEVDRDRIKKFLDSKPRGEAFIQKQRGLQLSNPLTQTGNAIFALGANRSPFAGLGPNNLLPFTSLLENTRIYNNGANTLTQVGLMGTGAHALRAGTVPFDQGGKYYIDIVGAESLLSADEAQVKNRLLILSDAKLSAGSGISRDVRGIVEANRLGISLNKNLMFDYLTGPGSVYGVGKTTIRRYEDTRNASISKLNFGTVMTYDDLSRAAALNSDTQYEGRKTKNLQDFKTFQPFNFPYFGEVKTRENLYNFYLNPSGGTGTGDGINSQFFKVVTNVEDPFKDNIAKKDIIKFGFEFISNDDPTQSTFIQFRAFLTNGITDTNQASYQTFKYIGRGEDNYVYQGFSRNISFGFKIAAQGENELRPIYQNLNYLVSQIYPDYSPSKKVMRAGITRLTIGDYLYRTPGFLENVNITINNDTPWEIREDARIETDRVDANGDPIYNQVDFDNRRLAQVPQIIDIAITFKPIFDKLPKRSIRDTAFMNTAVVLGGTAASPKVSDPFNPSTTPTEETALEQVNRARAERKQARVDARIDRRDARINARTERRSTRLTNDSLQQPYEF